MSQIPSQRASSQPLSPSRLALLAAAALFFVGLLTAANRSLWLDEFHSLHHARNLDLGLSAFFEDLQQDNHPPLYFVLLWVARALFGEGPIGLRSLGLAAAVANVFLVRRLANSTAPAARHAALRWSPLLVASSTLLLHVATEARMYALLALASTWLLLVLATLHRRRPLELSVVTATGLLTHYYFGHALLVLCAAAFAWPSDAAQRGPTRRRLLAGLGGGLLLASPWLLTGFRHQLLEQNLAPGGTRVSALKLAESVVHLQFHQVSLGPAWLQVLVIPASLAFLALLALGTWRVVRMGPALSGPARLLVAAALGLPLWSGLFAIVIPRAGFNWNYLAGSIGAAAVLGAFGSEGPGRSWRRIGTGFVVGVAATLGLAISSQPGTEDTRGAVDRVLSLATPRDALAVVEWQAPIFAPGSGWDYYRAERRFPGRRLEVTPSFDLEEPGRLAAAPRAFVVARGVPPSAPIWTHFRSRYRSERLLEFGYSLRVHVFSEP